MEKNKITFLDKKTEIQEINQESESTQGMFSSVIIFSAFGFLVGIFIKGIVMHYYKNSVFLEDYTLPIIFTGIGFIFGIISPYLFPAIKGQTKFHFIGKLLVNSFALIIFIIIVLAFLWYMGYGFLLYTTLN